MNDEILRCAVAAESIFNMIYKSRLNSILKSSEKFTKAYSDNEMDFFKNRQNYLVEGTYHLLKVLVLKGGIEEMPCCYLTEKFVSMQSNRVLSCYSDTEIYNLFNGRNREVVKK